MIDELVSCALVMELKLPAHFARRLTNPLSDRAGPRNGLYGHAGTTRLQWSLSLEKDLQISDLKFTAI